MSCEVRHKSGRVLFVTSDEFIADNRRNMGWIVEGVKMTSREQFEEWCINRGISITKSPGYDGYQNPRTKVIWEGWQASRAAIEIELPEPCSPGDFCVDIPVQVHHEVVEAIDLAGLKVKK